MQLRNALIIAGALALGGIGLSFAQVLPQPGPPVPIAGAYNTTPPTLTDGQAGWAQLDSGGKLLVSSTFTPSGTQDVNVKQWGGVTGLVGNGVTGTGSPRVTIASDNTAFSVNATLSAETTKVIGTVNQGTSPWVNNVSQINGITPLMGNGVTGTGSQRVTIASDNTAFSVNAVQSGTWTVQPGNTANTTPWLTTNTPSSAAGTATTSASSTAAASSLVLKASAGNLYNLTATIGATSGYLMLFDATSLPSNGAVTPVFCAPVTSNGTNGSISLDFSTPKRFGTGITAGFSTTGCFTLTASATGNFFGGYQ